eukprot:2268785-Rhodomonas_salina.2
MKDIRSFLRKRSRDEARAGSSKKPKISTPAGMALVATEQLTVEAKSLSAVAEKFQHTDPPVRTRNQFKQQQQGTKAPRTQQKQTGRGAQNDKPASSSDNNLIKNAAGVTIECDLCKKVGISLPESNHVAHECPNMRQNIQKLSGPTLQGASVPGSGSKQYVPPAGTAQAQVAMKRTQTSTGVTFAQQVFSPQTSNGFGFSAMSASHRIDKDALPIPTSEDHDLLSLPGSLSAHPLLNNIHEHGWWYFQVLLMTICLLMSLYAVYSTTVGVLTTFSHVTAVMSTALAFPLSKFRSRDRPSLTMNQTQLALSAINGMVSSQHVYFLDSCCSYTLLSNASVFRDLHEIPPVTIEGLTGTRVLRQGGTMTLTVPDFNGNAHEIEIENVLYDPLATVNLISVKQMNNAGYGFALMPNESVSAIITPPSTWPSTLPVYLPIIQQNNVFMLSEIDTEVAPEVGNSSAYNASRFSHHTLEEILHRRYNHAPTECIAKMNGKVRGLPRPIRNTRTMHKSFCSWCYEANATRQNFSDSSDTV